MPSSINELDPELENDPPFVISDSMSAEQLKTIRDAFRSAANAFARRINARIECDEILENRFGL